MLWNVQWKKDSLSVHHQYLRTVDLWEWKVKLLDSSLIKRLLQMKDCILVKTGTAQEGQIALNAWFAEEKHKGTAVAYWNEKLVEEELLLYGRENKRT